MTTIWNHCIMGMLPLMWKCITFANRVPKFTIDDICTLTRNLQIESRTLRYSEKVNNKYTSCSEFLKYLLLWKGTVPIFYLSFQFLSPIDIMENFHKLEEGTSLPLYSVGLGRKQKQNDHNFCWNFKSQVWKNQNELEPTMAAKSNTFVESIQVWHEVTPKHSYTNE